MKGQSSAEGRSRSCSLSSSASRHGWSCRMAVLLLCGHRGSGTALMSHRKQGCATAHMVLFDARHASWCHPFWTRLNFIYRRNIFRLFFPLFGVFLSHVFEVSTTWCDLLNRLENFKWLVPGADSKLLHVQENLNFAAILECIQKNMGVVEGGCTWRRARRKEEREVQGDPLSRPFSRVWDDRE